MDLVAFLLFLSLRLWRTQGWNLTCLTWTFCLSCWTGFLGHWLSVCPQAFLQWEQENWRQFHWMCLWSQQTWHCSCLYSSWVPFDFASFQVLGAMRTLSAPSWVWGVISVVRRCRTSFSLWVEAWFWPLTESSVSVFIGEHGKVSVEHGRILFSEGVLGNFLDCAFSSLTYLFWEFLKPCGMILLSCHEIINVHRSFDEFVIDLMCFVDEGFKVSRYLSVCLM